MGNEPSGAFLNAHSHNQMAHNNHLMLAHLGWQKSFDNSPTRLPILGINLPLIFFDPAAFPLLLIFPNFADTLYPV